MAMYTPQDPCCPDYDYTLDANYSTARDRWECAHCGEHVIEPPDGAPCCPDPDCPGRFGTLPCTFPGYADNH